MWVYCVYLLCIYSSAVKVNALTQIHFNGTNFFNARLTQRIFSVWPVAQPVVGEMEMHSVANLATLQTPLATFFPSKKHPNLVSEYCRTSERSCSPSARTLSLSLCVCSVSLPSARTPPSLSLSLSLRLLSYVLMGRFSVTISYSFRCLTTETVKYANENSFIENLAASKIQ